jgi:hypothetical protein
VTPEPAETAPSAVASGVGLAAAIPPGAAVAMPTGWQAQADAPALDEAEVGAPPTRRAAPPRRVRTRSS